MQAISSIAEVIKRIQILRTSAMGSTTHYSNDEPAPVYDCSDCKDEGYIIDGWKAKACSCLEQKRYHRRLNSAMIPDEFKNATFKHYKVTNRAQKRLLDAAVNYLKNFDITSGYNLGFMGEFGESRIKAIRDPHMRRMAKEEHNNFGLGKTHLQIAVARHLLKKGIAVLIVSDAVLMDELMMLKVDDKETYFKRVNDLVSVPVLVWDDIGKSNHSPSKELLYYYIMDSRFKANRPILFSSNEDPISLEDKIGIGASSRLLGKARVGGDLILVEGPDYRITGEGV